MPEIGTHRDALIELVQFARPLSELRDLIGAFPYDFEGEEVSLTGKHISYALQRLVDGVISANDLEAWAELVEGRPGIEYDHGMEERISEVLYYLSTPEINEPITAEICQRLLETLR